MAEVTAHRRESDASRVAVNNKASSIVGKESGFGEEAKSANNLAKSQAVPFSKIPLTAANDN